MKKHYFFRKNIFLYSGLCLFSIVALIPFLYMFSTSMLENSYSIPFPPKLLPKQIDFSNYATAWRSNNFGRYFMNSLFVSTAATLLIMVVSTLSAYGFSRINFPGREVLFGLYLFSMMIPSITNLTPLFSLMKSLHLVDSFTGLIILYSGLGIASNTYFLRNFFLSFPHELEEAIVIDGGGRWTCFFHLILPLSKPCLATFGILAFANNWDEFLNALIFIKTENKRTLPIALKLFEGQHKNNWALIFAASIIAIAPIIIIYIVFQKYLIKGGVMEGTMK